MRQGVGGWQRARQSEVPSYSLAKLPRFPSEHASAGVAGGGAVGGEASPPDTPHVTGQISAMLELSAKPSGANHDESRVEVEQPLMSCIGVQLPVIAVRPERLIV